MSLLPPFTHLHFSVFFYNKCWKTTAWNRWKRQTTKFKRTGSKTVKINELWLTNTLNAQNITDSRLTEIHFTDEETFWASTQLSQGGQNNRNTWLGYLAHVTGRMWSFNSVAVYKSHQTFMFCMSVKVFILKGIIWSCFSLLCCFFRADCCLIPAKLLVSICPSASKSSYVIWHWAASMSSALSLTHAQTQRSEHTQTHTLNTNRYTAPTQSDSKTCWVTQICTHKHTDVHTRIGNT